MTLYTNSLKYLIIYYSLLVVFCYLLLLLFMEILNLKNLKRILSTSNVDKLEFQKDLYATNYNNIYNNNTDYLSKNWYLQKNL
jgi:hypothetical protein